MKYIFLKIFFLLFIPTVFFGQNTKNSTNVQFSLQFNDKEVAFGEDYISKNKDTLSLESIKFYISSFEVMYKNKEVFKEKNSYHLIDLDDSETLKFNLPTISKEEIVGIKFNIGVDSLASVSGAMEGDLDATKGMYWAWQSGFINLKIEGKSKSVSARKNKFHLHVGGYLAPNYAMRTVELKGNQIKNNKIYIKVDVAKIFDEIDLHKTNSVMIPGKEAMEIADISTKMFSLP